MRGELSIDSRTITYSLIRRARRKTVGIRVTSADEVQVFAPQSLGEERIRQIVRDKASWIMRRAEKIAAVREAFPQRRFVSGESIIYLGKSYRLDIREVKGSSRTAPRLEGDALVVLVRPGAEEAARMKSVRNRISVWYRANADSVIRESVTRFAKVLRCSPRQVIVKEQKNLWGSCSVHGALRFNWRIVMAPVSVIDYVVAHEMCHLLVADHSREFWRQVSHAMPDHAARRTWLNEHAYWLKLSF
jgi:predicted metal-dependent hydrolase